MTRWIIVITGRPAVCHDIDGTCEDAVRLAAETANECGHPCILQGNLGGPWRQFGTFNPQHNHGPQPQRRANEQEKAT